jgi:ribonuclease HI
MAEDLKQRERFLAELASSLDVEATRSRLGLSAAEARAILLSCIPARPPQQAQKKRVVNERCVVNVDGASRGNPGPAGAGAVIKGPDGEVLKRLTKNLGIATNNVAEYEALILALEEAVSLGCSAVDVFADSELMVKQMRGEYRVKNEALKGLHAIAKKLVESFRDFSISHVRREFNSEADGLANEAIDK